MTVDSFPGYYVTPKPECPINGPKLFWLLPPGFAELPMYPFLVNVFVSWYSCSTAATKGCRKEQPNYELNPPASNTTDARTIQKTQS